MIEAGIVDEAESGGTHTSRTIMLRELRQLLSNCPAGASKEDLTAAILVDNVLAKRSESSRQRSLRYLKELYVLDRQAVLYRALRDLWDADEASQPLLALMCSLARDPLLRATADTVLGVDLDGPVNAAMLAAAVGERFPGNYGDAVRNKVGRNAASSWTQSGHLEGRSAKRRIRAVCRPAAVAYALMLGHLSDARGIGLLRTVWGRALDAPDHLIYEHGFAAAQRGWIEFRRAGQVVDVGFGWLLRPMEA
jgi:BrxA